MDTQVQYVLPILVILVLGCFQLAETIAINRWQKKAFKGIAIFRRQETLRRESAAAVAMDGALLADPDISETSLRAKPAGPDELLLHVPLVKGWKGEFHSVWMPLAGRLTMDRSSGQLQFRVYLTRATTIFLLANLMYAVWYGYATAKLGNVIIGLVYIGLFTLGMYFVQVRHRLVDFWFLLSTGLQTVRPIALNPPPNEAARTPEGDALQPPLKSRLLERLKESTTSNYAKRVQLISRIAIRIIASHNCLGGIAGVGLAAYASTIDLVPAMSVLILLLPSLYAVYASVLLWRHPQKYVILSVVLFCLQIPLLVTDRFSYSVFFGSGVYLSQVNDRLIASPVLGAEVMVGMYGIEGPPQVGINLLAFILAGWLLIAWRRMRTFNKVVDLQGAA